MQGWKKRRYAYIVVISFLQSLSSEISSKFPILKFDTNTIKLGGVINRFDSLKANDSAVWVAVHSWEYKGNTYYKAIYGSWHEDSQYQFASYDTQKSSGEFKKKEKEIYQEAQKKLKEEKEEKHESCKNKWSPVYESIPQNRPLHSYLAKKKIDKNYLARVTDAGALLIPAWGDDRQFVGCQQIFLDPEKKKYEKRFTFGIKILGSFCPFGKVVDAQIVYIAEGFATAASVWMALKEDQTVAVVAAFNTSNLLPCGKTIRKLNKSCKIVFAADHDVHNDKKHHNIGERKAKFAARKLGNALAKRVVFAEKNAAYSDFNDLHCVEGIDAVKKQLSPDNLNFYEIIPLGYSEDNHYWFYSTEKRMAFDLPTSQLTKQRLSAEATNDYWAGRYGYGKDKDGEDTDSPCWGSVTAKLSAEVRRAGPYDPEGLRKNGVWDEDEGLVVNIGNELWHKGERQPLNGHQIKTKNVYAAGKIKYEMVKPLTVEQAAKIERAFFRLNYVRRADYVLLLGWIYAVQTFRALKWRPHIWITGDHGSGKSTILQYIRGMIPFSILVSGATASGIRQGVNQNAFATIIDEAEPGKPHERGRIDAIVEMARLASTKGDYKLLRGTPGGKVQEYNTNHVFCLGSIQFSRLSPADQSRFINIAFSSKGNDGEQFRQIDKAMNEAMGLADALLARCVANIDVFRENIRRVEQFLSGNASRLSNQISPLVAGYLSLIHDGLLDDKKISEIINDVKSSAIADLKKDTDNDASRCLADILNLPLNFSNRTVAQEIDDVLDWMRSGKDEQPQTALNSLGMRIDRKKWPNGTFKNTLFISNRNIALDNALKKIGSSYVNYAQLLMNHPKYIKSDICRINKQVVRGKVVDVTEYE